MAAVRRGISILFVPAVGLALASCGGVKAGPGAQRSASTSPTSTPTTTTPPPSTTTTPPPSTSTSTPPPTLGRAGVFLYSTGFGEVMPSSVFLGGEAESAVSQITWSSWGDAEASGKGTGCYYAGTIPAAQCRSEEVTLFAFDLGTCQGTYMYQQLEYVFLEEGETFDPSNGIDICTEQ